MPKSKRRPPQAESETISHAMSASVEESGASEVEEEIAEERDLDERQVASWMKQATAIPGFGGKKR